MHFISFYLYENHNGLQRLIIVYDSLSSLPHHLPSLKTTRPCSLPPISSCVVTSLCYYQMLGDGGGSAREAEVLIVRLQ